MNAVRTFAIDGAGLDEVLAAKAGRTVSVCIPCHNEAATIGPLVAMMRRELVEGTGVVDELIVLDDRSTDDTATVAAQAGATVVPIADIHANHGVGHGKGNALWASLVASHGDFVVWCDGDVTSVEPYWVGHLLTPLVTDDDVSLVKAMYQRPSGYGSGGRTTELVARPLLSLFFPELAGLHQPLSGEYAGRRDVLEQIPFVEGWGVEIAILIDIARRCGADSIAQVDLGVREHRNRSLHELSVQAAEVMATVLARRPDGTGLDAEHLALTRADGTAVPLNLDERPPVAKVLGSDRLG